MKSLLIILLCINLFANGDYELISKAYKSGLKPVPSNFESLLHELKLDNKDISKEKVLLGKKLFFEKELSKGKDISCASCHSFNKGGADAMPTAIGHNDLKNPFHLNTPTVLNTAFSKNFFWNGGTKTLKEQAKGPLQAEFEMAITPQLAEKRIRENKEYKVLFKNAFGSMEITFDKIAEAISVYENTLVTTSRYDKFLSGDIDALTQNEKKGIELFITKGCVGCHNGIGLGGQKLRKFPLTYHNVWSLAEPKKIDQVKKRYIDTLKFMETMNLKNEIQKFDYLKSSMGSGNFEIIEKGFFYQIDDNQKLKVITSNACNECHLNNSIKIQNSLVSQVAFPFDNKGDFLGSKDKEKYFRVPLLRNIVQTKPYFHNGTITKLEDAIKLMGVHQTRNNLTKEEIDNLISFFESLDGELIEYKIK